MSRIILITVFFVLACNTKKEENPGDVTLEEDTITELRVVAKPPAVSPGCYGWTAGSDTAMLKLNVTENKVTGNLNYRLHEKDSNTGTLTGVIEDSLIVANYTFQSEGKTSVRELVFKIKGDSLIEGFGDVNTSGDTVQYKNKMQLQYHHERPFLKRTCL